MPCSISLYEGITFHFALSLLSDMGVAFCVSLHVLNNTALWGKHPEMGLLAPQACALPDPTDPIRLLLKAQVPSCTPLPFIQVPLPHLFSGHQGTSHAVSGNVRGRKWELVSIFASFLLRTSHVEHLFIGSMFYLLSELPVYVLCSLFYWVIFSLLLICCYF